MSGKLQTTTGERKTYRKPQLHTKQTKTHPQLAEKKGKELINQHQNIHI
jgi:hypothetical protein